MRRSASTPAALRLAAGALGLMLAEPASANDAKLLAYGRHLSGECSGCHRADGTDNGIPSITGWDPATFIATLIFYRNGERTNPAMVSVAQSLNEPEYRALAAYYGSLSKPSTAARKK